MPGRGSRAFSLLLFSAELLALLEAGLSLVETFEALLEKEGSPIARAVLERLIAQLRDGQRFSAALALQPEVFLLLTSASSRLPRAPATCRTPCRAISTIRHGSTLRAASYSVRPFTRPSCLLSALR